MRPTKNANNLSEAEIGEKIIELRRLLQENRSLSNIQQILADANLKNLQSDDDYLKRFLYSTSFDVQEAVAKMKLFYETLLEFPEWFTKEPPIQYKKLIDRQSRLLSDVTDKDGRPIYIVKLARVEPNVMSLLENIAIDDIWIESILDEMPIRNGLCVIVDISGLPYSILKWCTPQNVKVTVKRLDSYPVINYVFHVVNNALLVNIGINLVWPFLPDHLKNKVKFHFNNRESLYEYIDKDCLPPEYGGNKTIDPNDCLKRLYEKNDQIAKSFKVHRTLSLIEY